MILKTVLVFGTFDVLHRGHIWFLGRAAQFGNYLTATVARDSFVSSWKGNAPDKNESERLERVSALPMVDKAVLADYENHSYGVIISNKPDIICLGHDQQALGKDLTLWLNDNNVDCDLAILPPWRRKDYSSSLRKRRTLIHTRPFH